MTDAVLDEAARALRLESMEPAADGEATLARLLATRQAEAALDEAAEQLARQTEPVDGPYDSYQSEETLARIHASLGLDQSLDTAADALRTEPGPSAEVASAAPAANRRAPRRPPAHALAFAAAAAIALVGLGAPTAWAWSTGRIHAVFRQLGWLPADPVQAAPSPKQAPTRARRQRATARSEAVPTPSAEAPETVAAELDVAGSAPAAGPPAPLAEGALAARPNARPPRTARPNARPPRTARPRTARPRATRPRAERDRRFVDTASSAGPPVVAAPSPETPREPERPRPPATDAENRAFEAAYRPHVRRANPAQVVAGWDRYLASFPGGRYELEARYNRAIALLRGGSLHAARRALVPFARGRGYRKPEAQSLVDAIDARLGSP